MQRWCKARLATLKSYRKSWPAGLCLMLSGVMNAEMLNAACYEQMARCEHELVDMGLVAQQLALKKPKRGGKRWSTKKGKCAYKDCAPLSCEPKRSQWRCGSCNHGKGAYYHPRCFFKVHRCGFMGVTKS